jgi:serine/threonine-protein kinase RsbT
MLADRIRERPAAPLSRAASRLDALLEPFLAAPNRRALLGSSAARASVDLASATEDEVRRVAAELPRGLRVFLTDPIELDACLRRIGDLDAAPDSDAAVDVRIETEDDILRCRGRARAAASRMGFSQVVATKLITAVSELARNAFQYAGGGTVSVRCLFEPRRGVEVVATDSGPGIAHLGDVLAGTYKSKHGMGMGLRGTKALMDEFDIRTGPRGTTITIRKFL